MFRGCFFMNFFNRLPLKKYIFSFALSFVVTLLFLSVASIIFSFFPPSEWVLGAFSDYSYLASAFITAFLCARHTPSHGFLTGITSAAVYVSFLLVLGFIFFKSTASLHELGRIFLFSSLCGGVGGILGINCK